jgi:hypothetical protein
MSRSQGRWSEEMRLERAMAAAERERRNRPRGLVVLAALVLVVSGVAAATGVAARSRTFRELTGVLDDQAHVEAMAAEFRALAERQRTAGTQGAGQSMPNFRSRMESLARTAGLTGALPQPLEAAPGQGPVVTRIWTYELQEASIKPVLEWIRLATVDRANRIEGLEVYSLDLKPGPDKWNINLKLRRWERAS